MQKKSVVFLFLLMILTLPAFTQDRQDFEEIVEFSINLELLNRFYERNPADTVPTGKILILDGAISALEVIREEPEDFLAELTIVGGKWRGTVDVKMFFCIVQIEGPDFAERVPARRSRREPRDAIKPNLNVIVIGKVIDTRTDADGNIIPVLEGFYIRPLN